MLQIAFRLRYMPRLKLYCRKFWSKSDDTEELDALPCAQYAACFSCFLPELKAGKSIATPRQKISSYAEVTNIYTSEGTLCTSCVSKAWTYAYFISHATRSLAGESPPGDRTRDDVWQYFIQGRKYQLAYHVYQSSLMFSSCHAPDAADVSEDSQPRSFYLAHGAKSDSY